MVRDHGEGERPSSNMNSSRHRIIQAPRHSQGNTANLVNRLLHLTRIAVDKDGNWTAVVLDHPVAETIRLHDRENLPPRRSPDQNRLVRNASNPRQFDFEDPWLASSFPVMVNDPKSEFVRVVQLQHLFASIQAADRSEELQSIIRDIEERAMPQ